MLRLDRFGPRALVLFVAFAALLGLASPQRLAPTAARAAVGDCTPGADWGTTRPDLASRVVDLVNSHRRSLGLVELRASPTLTSSAVWKSAHMAKYAYFTHDDPAPPVARTPGQRLQACGYSASAGWGENIAWGYTTPEAVMQAWLNSSGHRANIERASFRAIGVGTVANGSGRLYWTQNFGTVDDSGSTTPPPPPPPPPPAPPPPPPVTPVSAAPGSVTIQNGSLRGGGVSSLAADDSNYLAVAASSFSRVSSWSGRFSAVPNALRSLRVSYRGLSSATCSQTVSIWNATQGTWVSLDSRSVGPSEIEVAAVPVGTLADYVSGSSGNGDVTVRVRCTRSDSVSFTTNADLLRIVYET